MSNIPANNRPDPAPGQRLSIAHQLQIEVHSHLDEEPDPSGAGSQTQLPAISADTLELLREAAAVAAVGRGFRRGSIEIAVVDDRRIHQLNHQFLEHDWETDVISFPYACEGEFLQGELIVSWETALRQAANTGWPAATELGLYVIHGTLHLTGMEDTEAADRQQMRTAEQLALKTLGVAGAERYDVDHPEAETGPPGGDAAGRPL